jgi:hypothetical protein
MYRCTLCDSRRVIGSDVRIDASLLSPQLPHFNRWMLSTRSAGGGNGVAVGRTIYDLGLNNVIVAPYEK